jgi:uncharacterized membrane protein YphA (DoxX/SURF4 family)
MVATEAGWLILRIAYGGLFIFTAWTLATGWDWTVANTAVLFGAARAKLFSVGAIATMSIGGMLIVLGFFGRLGALMLLVFLILGTMIHVKERDQVPGLAQALRDNAKAAGHQLDGSDETTLMTLQVSAFSAHVANVYKNVCLAGIALFFILVGTGPGSLDCDALHFSNVLTACFGGRP